MKTDWDQYYRTTSPLSKFTRPLTFKRICKQIENSGIHRAPFSVVELGGGNSSFYDPMMQRFPVSEYHVIDNNLFGLGQMSARILKGSRTHLHQLDVLNLNLNIQFDLVYSVGLIEHFSVEETRHVIQSHFKLAKPGGFVLITFPTPTFLYRMIRGVVEVAGQWQFPDERPLEFDEVLNASKDFGDLRAHEIIWPIGLTQGLVIWKCL